MVGSQGAGPSASASASAGPKAATTQAPDEVEDRTKWCTWRIWDQNISKAIDDHLDDTKSKGKNLSKWGLSELILQRIKSTPLADMIDLHAPYNILQVTEVNSVTFDKNGNQKLMLDTELFKLANNEHVSEEDRKWEVLVEGRVAELIYKTIDFDDLLIIWNGDLDFTQRKLTLKKVDANENKPPYLITIFHQYEAPKKDKYDRFIKDYFMKAAVSIYYPNSKNEKNIVEVICPIFKQIPEPEEEKTQISSKSDQSISVVEESDEVEDIEVISKNVILVENEITIKKTATPKKTDPNPNSIITIQNGTNGDQVNLMDSQMLMNTQYVNLNDEEDNVEEIVVVVNEKNNSNESNYFSDCESVNQIIDQLTFKETQELLNSNTIPQSSQELVHENVNVNSGNESGDDDNSKMDISDNTLQQRKILEFGDLTEDMTGKFMIKAQIIDSSSGISHQDKDKFVLTVTDGTFTPFNIKEHYPKIKDTIHKDTQQLKIGFPTYDILIRNGNSFRNAINGNGIKINEFDTILLGFITLEKDNDEFLLTMDGKNFQYRKLMSITNSADSQIIHVPPPNSPGKNRRTRTPSNQQVHENKDKDSDSDAEFASCQSGSGSDDDENQVKKVGQKKQVKVKSPQKKKDQDKVSPSKTTLHDNDTDHGSESDSRRSKSPRKVTINDPSKSKPKTPQKNNKEKSAESQQEKEGINNKFLSKTYKVGDGSSTVQINECYVPIIRVDVEAENARLRKRSEGKSRKSKSTLNLRGKNLKRIKEEHSGNTTTEESDSDLEESSGSEDDSEIESKKSTKKSQSNKKPKPSVKLTPKKRKKKTLYFTNTKRP